MCCGAIQKRDLQGKQSVLPHFSDRQRCPHSPVLHANGNCSLYLKKKGCIICSWQLRGTLHCFGLCEPVFELVEDEKKSYCWIGFCARDLFKHSEAKWRVLPSLFSEALELGPTVYKNGTLVEFTLAAFFCRFPIASAGP